MSKPTAVQAEALGAATEFEFDGETYTVAPASEWDLSVLEDYEDGKIVSAVRALLGDAGWTKFRAKPRSVSDLNSLFEALQHAVGLAGN